jgi:eukaryotic-like serine/threonine-protein kinase
VTAPSWGHVKEFLHQALALDAQARALFLDEACGSNAALRGELESLLSIGDGLSPEFLESPPPARFGAGDDAFAAAGLTEGQQFAERFQLIRKFGEGGMGQVWLAEQTAPVRRIVALKLIKAGMYDETVVQRFQAERQSLAIMDHPAIAKVFDAGITPQGRPYFVMEYVPGLPITEYCDQHKLEIRERIELLIQACDGVQHAHQKAIIHRDLKPANILVIEVDGEPVPRIIDFGLAKATTAPAADQTLYTRFGQFMGTPGYMSPEQVNPNVRDIDTRTDVYSLGVILYELLTGLQPFEGKERKRPSLEEWLRQLREEEPRRPSSKIGADRETSTETAVMRGTEAKQLVSQLRGDLDWITMKALERDRDRRYGTPAELAADLRRFLHDEPVVARPASFAYQLGKLVRRHRAAAAMAAGLLLLLAAFSALQGLQLEKTTRERDRATRITDFMTSMFKVSDPSEARGNAVTAREILDKASKEIGTGLARDPEVQSQMRQVMASTYLNLGLYARAHELAQNALDSRLRLDGPADPNTLESMSLLGWILARETHDNKEAETLERKALEGEQRTLGPEHPLTLATKDRLAMVLQHQGHYEQAEQLESEIVEAATRRLGPENALTLESMNHLGVAQLRRGEFAPAERTYRQLLDADRRAFGPDHPESLKALNNLAVAMEMLDRWAEAEPLLREALAIQQRVLGPEHQNTVTAMNNLAAVLVHDGRVAEGEPLIRQALAIQVRTLGPDHPETLGSNSALGDALYKEGRFQEAETVDRQTLASQARVLGPKFHSTLLTQDNLSATLIREGRYAEAEQLARDAFENQREKMGLQHPYTLNVLKQLGKALAFQQRYPEAEKLYRDAIDAQDKSGGNGSPWLVWYGFACVAMAANRSDEALRDLQQAVSRGYRDADEMMADDDLKDLRTKPAFLEILATIRRDVRTTG